MLAVTAEGGGISVREHTDPVPGLGQVLVRVRAAGLNGADLLQKRGLYPAPPGVPADIPGLELTGEVLAAGPDATRFGAGDRVMAVVAGGGQAELAVVHEREAMPVPPGLDWASAGGLPEVFTTAHDALFTQAGLRPGERVCVHGAAGGVGTAAVQLAVTAGCAVVATVRSAERRAALEQLGATAIDPDETEANGPYDVVLELVGAPNLDTNLRSLATGGRICVIGIGAGATGQLNLGLLMARRGRIHGSTLRARPLEGKAAAARLVESHVLPLFETGRLRVPIDATFPLSEAADAYDRFEAGGKFGKIVLTAGP
ncbi:MAG TPA: NAD(P)H-quinone oxidoreductase [Acidimicrobiales bacterium]|nr:NAD(P)H-quinone oxidoreductase [Acidimicrobiales bacterium]